MADIGDKLVTIEGLGALLFSDKFIQHGIEEDCLIIKANSSNDLTSTVDISLDKPYKKGTAGVATSFPVFYANPILTDEQATSSVKNLYLSTTGASVYSDTSSFRVYGYCDNSSSQEFTASVEWMAIGDLAQTQDRDSVGKKLISVSCLYEIIKSLKNGNSLIHYGDNKVASMSATSGQGFINKTKQIYFTKEYKTAPTVYICPNGANSKSSHPSGSGYKGEIKNAVATNINTKSFTISMNFNSFNSSAEQDIYADWIAIGEPLNNEDIGVYCKSSFS